jgi:poly(3-hydroxybutyrate) depolymerase
LKQVITAGDANRSYLLAEPPPDAPVSTVVTSLHGTRSTARDQARPSGFEQLAQTASAVVVFPQAIEPIGSGYEWDPSQDVDYIAGLATELLSRYRAPHGRVVLTGMSGGARMSSVFASAHPELVPAVGAVPDYDRRDSQCTGAAARNVGTKASPMPPEPGRGPTASRLHPWKSS